LAGYYVRFWSRLFTYFNATGRHPPSLSFFAKATKESATADRLRHEEYSHEKAQNAQKGQKNDQKSAL